MIANKQTLISAAAYYRMSSDKQDASIGQQVQAVERFAAENGYRIVRDYKDEGISGDATTKRHGFRTMMADCARGDFSVILAWSIDRIGRFDSLEAGYWIQPMRDAGVRLVTLAEGEVDFEDFGGRLIYSVQAEAKHGYLKDLAKNVSRGLWNLASEGRWAGGDPPLGYRIEGGRLAVHAEEAEIVRRVFREYDGGFSLREIAERLNRDGIVPTLRRRRPNDPRACLYWRANVLAPIITNVVYLGTLRWNHKQTGKYARLRRGAVEPVRRGEKARRDASDMLLVENNHEPIVDRDLFERAGRKLAENSRRTSPYRHNLKPLTGLCRCGFCGFPMTYSGGQDSRRHKFRYVVCTSHLHHGRDICLRRAVREDVLLPTIVGVIRDRLLAPENSTRLRAALERLCRDRKAPGELNARRKELAVLEDDIVRARRRVVEVDSDMLDVAQDHLRELRRRHESLAETVRDLEWRTNAGAEDIEATVGRAMVAAAELATRLADADPRALREALRESVEGVTVWVDRTFKKRRTIYRLTRGEIVLRSDGSTRAACLTQAAAS